MNARIRFAAASRCIIKGELHSFYDEYQALHLEERVRVYLYTNVENLIVHEELTNSVALRLRAIRNEVLNGTESVEGCEFSFVRRVGLLREIQ